MAPRCSGNAGLDFASGGRVRILAHKGEVLHLQSQQISCLILFFY